MKNIVQEWYEAKENVDKMNHDENRGLKKWEQNVTAHFPSKARVLDIGCGMGREAFALTDRGFSVTGIDISKEVIKQVTVLSKQKGYSIPYIQYDGHALPFESSSFDVIIIWAQTFGLLYGDEYKQEFLTECKRVLTNDGILSFSGHDYEFLTEHYMDCVKDKKFYAYANTEIYWETFYPAELIAFAENAGYTVILCEEGEIYNPEDGTILHCLCRLEGESL